jgi:hypothetical protein
MMTGLLSAGRERRASSTGRLGKPQKWMYRKRSPGAVPEEEISSGEE